MPTRSTWHGFVANFVVDRFPKMAKFALDIPHSLPDTEVRARLDRASAKLERDYGASCSWDKDQCLVVARKGLSARVAVEPEKLHVDVELGLLFGAMAGTIRNGITKQLTDLMAAPVEAPSPPSS